MALKKQVELPTGFTVEYWRVAGIVRGISHDSVVIEAYKDHTSRVAKKAPVTRKVFNAPSILSVDTAYTFIKTQPAFIGSEDC